MFVRALLLLGILVFGTAGVTVRMPIATQQDAGKGELLGLHREQLRTFRTVFVEMGHGPYPPVLRIDRSTGLATIDSSVRIAWDGTHVWLDASTAKVAERLGDEVDAKFEELLGELMSGLPNTTFIPARTEYWGPGNVGIRLDLPFEWDDEYAILVTGNSADWVSLTIVRKDDGTPLSVFGTRIAHVRLSFDWDVRLYDDLFHRENVSSRTFLVADDGFNQSWDGPHVHGGWHRETTSNRMLPVPFRGTTRQRARMTCTSPGEVSKTFALRYVLDPTAPSFRYLGSAIDAGCPFRVDMKTSHRHRAKVGETTEVEGTVRLVDTSVGPPSVLAEQQFHEEVAGGENQALGQEYHFHRMVPVASLSEATAIELWIDGMLTIECVDSTSPPPSSVELVILADESPVLSWPDCYPELGQVPTRFSVLRQY